MMFKNVSKDRLSNKNSKILFLIVILGCLSLSFIFSACKKEKASFASLSFSLRANPNDNNRVGFVRKGEKLYIVPEKIKLAGWLKLKLSDDSLGYAKAEYLAEKVFVSNSSSLELKIRPGVSSARSGSADKFKPASVAFVIKELKTKQDGVWYHVKGGYKKGTYFRGWIPANADMSDDMYIVRNAIDLENAIIKGDKKALAKLAETANPVAAVAATELEKLGGEEEVKEIADEPSGEE